MEPDEVQFSGQGHFSGADPHQYQSGPLWVHTKIALQTRFWHKALQDIATKGTNNAGPTLVDIELY